MRAAPASGEVPPAVVGPHCDEPYSCPFYEHCHEGLPEDPFAVLPRLSRKLRDRIASAGIGSLDELPIEFRGLSLIQRRALEALRNGTRMIDPGIREH
ncbi:MAG: hypothetical protein ABW318_21180 [Vicinamibacterales bacterium]